MKKILLFVLLFCISLGISAQPRVARIKKDIMGKDYRGIECVDYWKGQWVAYVKNRNGTIDVYGIYAEDQIYSNGPYSSSFVNNLQLTDYYLAEPTDPVDNYVNVRKGPGTNYPIVGKVLIGEWFFVKDLDSNWVKVYGSKDYESMHEGGSIGISVDKYSGFNPYEDIVFKGYMHKSRITFPDLSKDD